MTPAARDWLAGLTDFSEAHRAPRPERRVPVPSGIAAAVAAILAGHLEGSGGVDVIEALSRSPGRCVVLTTTPEAFPATALFASRMPSAQAARFVAVTETEYRGWCMRSPDEAFLLHANVWSWVKAPVPARRRDEFARWPLAAREDYWLHRHGRRDAAGEVRRADLWAWDGAQARFLAADVPERSGRLG